MKIQTFVYQARRERTFAYPFARIKFVPDHAFRRKKILLMQITSGTFLRLFVRLVSSCLLPVLHHRSAHNNGLNIVRSMHQHLQCVLRQPIRPQIIAGDFIRGDKVCNQWFW